MLEDVIQLHRAGRFEEAETGYRQLLAEHPDDPEVLHLLGILRGQRGDVAGGLEMVARAGALAPDNAACQHTLGEMYLSEGRLDEAEAAYERSRRLNPNLAAAHGGLGQIAFLRGDIDAAEEHFKVALRANENDVQAVTGLGNVAKARGDSARALQWFTQAAELAPDDPLIQTSYAQAMLEQGSLDFAAKSLDNALAAKPDYALAQALRADLHVRKREYAAAVPMFEALRARGEQVVAAYAGLGDIARDQGSFELAIAHYDEALRLQPDLHYVANRRADALGRSGHAAEAIEAMRARVAGYPEEKTGYLGLAAFLSQTNRHDEALAVWDAASARWPGDINLKALHALEFDRAGRSAEALTLAEAAATSPRPAIAMLRARGALLAGDPAAAVQRLQRIDPAQFEGKPPELARRCERLLGLAYDALEQWPDAVAAFAKAHHMPGGALPALPSLDAATRESLRVLADAPVLAEARGVAPVLVCGLLGSGVAQVAALLADQPGWVVRHDRFQGAPDFLNEPFDPRLVESLDANTLASLARRYQRAVARAGWPEGTRVADWIPVLDARVIPAAKRALPGVKLLIVARDLRETLLDWLAFGWSEHLAMGDPLEGARWLRLAYAQLEFAAELVPTLTLNPDTLLAEHGDAARQQLAEFMGLAAVTPGPRVRDMRKLRGGLPTSFSAGHAEHYRELLSDAFSALDG